MFEKKKLKALPISVLSSARQNVCHYFSETWVNFWIKKKIVDILNTS